MIFQSFDIVLYIKQFISPKYALPYYLVCKSTMSTSRNKDNEYGEIETYMDGFCSSSLLPWAIDMHMPVTPKLFAEVCGHGVLDDVKLLHQIYQCYWGDNAWKKTISNSHLHVLKYLCDNSPQEHDHLYLITIYCYAIRMGKIDVLEWICSHHKIEQRDLIDLREACGEAAKFNYMDVLIYIRSYSKHGLDWSAACISAAKTGNLELLEWIYMHSEWTIMKFQSNILLSAIYKGQLNVLEWMLKICNELPLKKYECHLAAKYGHLHILQWLRSLDPPCPWSEATFNIATFYKHKVITDWLQSLEFSCPFNDRTLVNAIHNGDLKLVQWLRSQTPPCPFMDDFSSVVLHHCHLDILEWLVANNAPCHWNWRCCYHALSRNDLNTLKWLGSLTPPCTWNNNLACQLAIQHGNLEMLQWLILSQNCEEMNKYAYIQAVEYDHIDILKWLNTHNQNLFNHFQYDLMKSAASKGHIHIMKWLYSLGLSFKWDKGITKVAVQGKNINALKWLRSQDPPCPWNEYEVYELASSTGNIMLMKCLRDLNPLYTWNDSLCANAAKNGHLRMLRWLRCQEPPCPIKLNQCIALAAEKEHIEVVDWLRIQSGCANCFRENCRCKNKQIILPENYELQRSKILYNRRKYDVDAHRAIELTSDDGYDLYYEMNDDNGHHLLYDNNDDDEE
jgi:hypothetical protein